VLPVIELLAGGEALACMKKSLFLLEAERPGPLRQADSNGQDAVWHWGFSEQAKVPDAWPLETGKWIVSSPHQFAAIEFPRRPDLRAFIPAGDDPGRAAAAVRAALAGWRVLPGIRDVRDRPDEALSLRELEVLDLLMEGKPNKAIASRLAISESTARFHIRSIYRKLGAVNRAQAVKIAFDRGLFMV
jgi:DNA-binding CsgD family transcriptional regulator